MVRYTFDSAHSSLEFSIRHLVIATLRGRFTNFAGWLELDPRDASRAEVAAEIDAASISTDEDRRDAHLRSAGFFDVAAHPLMSFPFGYTTSKITAIAPDPTSPGRRGRVVVCSAELRAHSDAAPDGGEALGPSAAARGSLQARRGRRTRARPRAPGGRADAHPRRALSRPARALPARAMDERARRARPRRPRGPPRARRAGARRVRRASAPPGLRP